MGPSSTAGGDFGDKVKEWITDLKGGNGQDISITVHHTLPVDVDVAVPHHRFSVLCPQERRPGASVSSTGNRYAGAFAGEHVVAGSSQ